MKNSSLFVMGLLLFALCSARSGQGQNALVGTGYPTSMAPGCTQNIPECKHYIVAAHPSAGSSGTVTPYERLEIAHPKEVETISPNALNEARRATIFTPPVPPVPVATITDSKGRSFAADETPQKTAGPYKMDYIIPISVLQDKCGSGLQPANLSVGYDFRGANTSSDPNARSLESFTISILQAGQQVYWGNLFQGITFADGMVKGAVIKTNSKKYPLSQLAQFAKVVENFQADNTLVLHAEGFQNIYVGVWCANPPKTSQPSK